MGGGRDPGDWEERLAAAGIAAEISQPLAVYLRLLGRFRAGLDLVGDLSAEALIREHVQPALAGAELLPARGRLLDLGSGGGLPAVPLLLARPEMRGTLLEPRERRWAFLREVVRELDLKAEVLRERVAEHRGGGYDAVSVRALAARWWRDELGRLLRPGGIALWWVGSERCAARPPRGLVPVVPSATSRKGRADIVAWRRCFT